MSREGLANITAAWKSQQKVEGRSQGPIEPSDNLSEEAQEAIVRSILARYYRNRPKPERVEPAEHPATTKREEPEKPD